MTTVPAANTNAIMQRATPTDELASGAERRLPYQLISMQLLNIHGFSYASQSSLQARIARAVQDCDGSVTDTSELSPAITEFLLQAPFGRALDLYVALVALGIELTRASHLALTAFCTSLAHARPEDLRMQISIRIEISFLETMT
ncbi:MAG: hypothetical protein FWD64_11680, partial [Acidobacteriaceae bacterium]|nr:hypothetical protein [Acidobacteriaceae bacterium]